MSQGFLHTLPHNVPHADVVGRFSFVGKWVSWVSRIVREHKKVVAVTVGALLFTYNAAAIVYRPTADVTFAQSVSCASKFVLLPDLHAQAANSQFNVQFKGGLSLFGLQLGTTKVCAQPNTAVTPGAIHSSHYGLFGASALQQTLMVATGEYPKLETAVLSQKTISANRALALQLNQHDALFDYQMQIKDQVVSCIKQHVVVMCDVPAAGLNQGESYDAKVQRMHNGQQVEELFTGVIKTAAPLEVVGASIKQNSTVYKPVDEIVIDGSHMLTGAPEVSVLIDGEPYSDFSIVVQDKNLKLIFEKPLPWRSKISVSVTSLEAVTGATLEQPYELAFTTSGGPKVVTSNVGDYKVEPSQVFTIDFDQALGSQSLGDKVFLTSDGNAVSASVSASGSRITIQPHSALDRCKTYTIKISNSVKNAFNIADDSAWEKPFKIRCAVVSSIGASVQGRSILSYSFGSGSSVVVFVGGMHGSESSGTNTLNDFINALEQNPIRIPANRRVVIIPNSNPDGIAVGSRTNANGVDLNRNFPANDWQKEVHMPGGVVSPNGGGGKALSEPESAALASYVAALSPRLVLTYHAVASVVIGNGSGDSDSLAGVYASKAGYTHQYDAGADETFGYPTTGEFEDWLHDKKGIPTLLVELGSSVSSQFYSNQDAMWYMATL